MSEDTSLTMGKSNKQKHRNVSVGGWLRIVRIAVTLCVATQSAPPQSDREYKVRTTKYKLWIA